MLAIVCSASILSVSLVYAGFLKKFVTSSSIFLLGFLLIRDLQALPSEPGP